VYKSDLIALDDSSANIRALIADARAFIASVVDTAMRGGSRDIGMTEFCRDPRPTRCISPVYHGDRCRQLTVKRVKTIATPRDIVFSRESYENPSP